jgi:CRISPR/Cas system CSM-associated protein Csm3 (group 7 of RAMP superfamily)
MKYATNYRARLTVEAAGPLAIGSGRKGLNVDRLVARDAYGLPYLPGTSLAGCLRSSLAGLLDCGEIDGLFGYQDHDQGAGSRLVVSSGHLVGSDGKVVGEAGGLPNYEDTYLKSLTDVDLPERDHVRINSRGVADGRAKFDEQLIPKGVRFVFEMSLQGTAEEGEIWKQLLTQFHQPFFRIGGGTRKGFGKLSIIDVHQCVLDLRETEQLNAYLNTSAALNALLPPALTTSFAPATAPKSDKWATYTLQLKARDFFSFGQGQGGIAADGRIKDGWVAKQPKRETTVVWPNGIPTLVNKEKTHYLIPGTSIKGALSHRTAFHFNKAKGHCVEDRKTYKPALEYEAVVADLLGEKAEPTTREGIEREIERLKQLQAGVKQLKLEESKTYKRFTAELEVIQTDIPNVGERNDAVRALFGFAVEPGDEESAQRGRVLIDDVFLDKKQVTPKVFSHVMIDRFTGGAKAGALFNEEVASTKEEIKLTIHVDKVAFEGDDWELIRSAFQDALLDLSGGQLPLGGGTAKGHGIFTGTVELPKNQTT